VAKQLRLIVILMFAAVLIYSGLWFTAAFQAEKDVARMFAGWRDQGIRVEHGKIAHGGFPYRITVDVEKLNVSTRSKGAEFRAESVTLISHLWTPGHWVAEARSTEVSLARGKIQFADAFMHGSYRLHGDGKAVIAVSPYSTDDMTLQAFLGAELQKPDDWHLFMRFGGDDGSAESSLYGSRLLDFKLTARAKDLAFETTGGLSGPAIRDWDKKQLANWRDQGGLLELDDIDYAIAGGRTKGSASLTIDENFRLIGSANLVRSGDSSLQHALQGLGLKTLGDDKGSGPASLMIQLGTIRLNGEPLAELKPIID